jgi:hypothetical protein
VCEQNGVSVLLYRIHRQVSKKDWPVLSIKTVKSNLLLIQYVEAV